MKNTKDTKIGLRIQMLSNLSVAIRNSGDPAWIAHKLNKYREIMGMAPANQLMAVEVAQSLNPEERTRPLAGQEDTRAKLIAEWIDLLGAEDFDWIVTIEDNARCGVWLADGSDVPCWVVAYDKHLKAYSVLKADGSTMQYLDGEVA